MFFTRSKKAKQLHEEGQRHVENKQFKEASKCFSEALNFKKNDPWILMSRGNANYCQAMILSIAGIPDSQQEQNDLLVSAIEDLKSAAPRLSKKSEFQADLLRAGCLKMLGDNFEALSVYDSLERMLFGKTNDPEYAELASQVRDSKKDLIKKSK